MVPEREAHEPTDEEATRKSDEAATPSRLKSRQLAVALWPLQSIEIIIMDIDMLSLVVLSFVSLRMWDPNREVEDEAYEQSPCHDLLHALTMDDNNKPDLILTNVWFFVLRCIDCEV